MSDAATTQEPGAVSASKLNLGCGDDYRSGWHNVDVDPGHDPDAVLDLEVTPWPWPDDHFDTILMDNVLEHIDPRRRPAVLDECRRVLRAGGTLTVRLPTRTGWDVTHYAVPSWRFYAHPRHRDDWSLVSVSGAAVGVGHVLPEAVARLLTRFDVVRCLREIEVVLR